MVHHSKFKPLGPLLMSINNYSFQDLSHCHHFVHMYFIYIYSDFTCLLYFAFAHILWFTVCILIYEEIALRM